MGMGIGMVTGHDIRKFLTASLDLAQHMYPMSIFAFVFHCLLCLLVLPSFNNYQVIGAISVCVGYAACRWLHQCFIPTYWAANTRNAIFEECSNFCGAFYIENRNENDDGNDPKTLQYSSIEGRHLENQSFVKVTPEITRTYRQTLFAQPPWKVVSSRRSRADLDFIITPASWSTAVPFFGNVFDIKTDGGDIIYTSTLGVNIIVLNSEEIVNELPEDRSLIYSDRPYMATIDLRLYGARLKIHNRLHHRVLRSQAALTYRSKQLQKAYEMLPSILRDPANCTGHFKAGIRLRYLLHDDVLLNAAERASDIFLRVAAPEKAAVLSAFPFCSVETTANSLLVFTVIMMNNPGIQERAQSEIDQVVGFDVFPILITFQLSRMAHSNMEDDFYKGYFIPKGASIVPNIWAMAHNPKKYPEPESFRPDRFLKHDGTLNDDILPWVFGFGRRRW
ncbi:cytochrome P450 [Rhizopogon salebrosus TDB-379]|nr:cytochrome P450 [Rhizopogon salebrosus TDB-379]